MTILTVSRRFWRARACSSVRASSAAARRATTVPRASRTSPGSWLISLWANQRSSGRSS